MCRKFMWKNMRFCQVAHSFGIVSLSFALNSINKGIQPKQKTKISIIKWDVTDPILFSFHVL